ncbi:MAG: hypothetical protein ACU83N_07325 [Gammaproteobacteria bacterium]
MPNELDNLLNKIKALEEELIEELQKQHLEFSYEIRKRGIYFEKNIIRRHKHYAKALINYIRDAPLKHIATAPIIWSCLLPACILDVSVSLYQAVCFPIYGIPKVRRQDYIVFDRQYLNYLNLIEKLNCAYCSYFNGLIGYVQEIAARTEQFWCPIKHARRIKKLHSRYRNFINYGDAESYRAQIESIRRNFADLEE